MLTKRIDLNLGYTCNLDCRFCYYRESLSSSDRKVRRDLSADEAKKWLRFFRRRGLEEVDLTGGEPTIRDDIFDLIAYAKEIGYRTVCLITNGVRLADRDFCRRLAESGVNDILFSLHGPDSRIHDGLTRVGGSFDQLLRGMENAAGFPVRLRSNTVVTGVNFDSLGKTAALLLEKRITRANFILFNPVEEARGAEPGIALRYRDAAPYLQRLIRKYVSSFGRIAVRYIPFCLMRGYESHVVNFAQVQYDPDEWDYFWRIYFRQGFRYRLSALGTGLLHHPAPGRLLRLDPRTASREAIAWSIIAENMKKGPPCPSCRYYRVCDGLWRNYADKFGFDELTPVPGAPIVDPVAMWR